MARGRLHAGAAEVEITPPAGVRLAGVLKPRVARGVHTPLMARALVFSNGEETLAILTLDLYGLSEGSGEKLVQAACARAGLKAEGLMVICSHTRAAPCTAPVVGLPDVEEPYLAQVVEKAVDAVTRARASLQPASLGLGRALLPHLVYNHRLITRNMKAITAWLGVPKDEVLEPEGPIDPEFSVFVVRDDRGFPLAFLWGFAADNRFSEDDLISADLPGHVQEELDRRLARHVPALYLGGCGGNVSYARGLEESADAVASAVMAVQLETPSDPSIRLGCARERMILPIRDYSRFWSRPDVELKWPEAAEAFSREVELMQAEGARAVPTAVQVFRLGRFALVGLPGMPFAEFALQIKAGSPFLKTVVAGNVGEHVGYVITRQAFENGGLEAWPARSSRVGPGGGEFMAEEAISLSKRLWSG
ncbi:MAG: hypothetical protein QME94_00005 [Anaerolineae bacterium]|nr:hypothetical protein [Anaerolineae bacterium]